MTEESDYRRNADKRGSDGLLLALVRTHGHAVKVEVSDEQPQVRLLQRQVGALTAQIGDMQLTIDRQRKIIVKFGESDDLEYPKIGEILEPVCEFYKINKAKITGHSRAYSLPRQVACYLAREMTRLSLPEIGRRMGGRDHSTVLHATVKIDELIKADDCMKVSIDRLRQQIEAKVAARNVIVGEESSAA